MRELEPMSRSGYNRLMEELKQLEEVELPEVQKTVALAREEGDLKENGAYIYGRQRQGHIVGRIGGLKGKLNRADIIDCTTVACDKAVFGTVVTLLDLDTEKKVTYQLLGPDDAELDRLRFRQRNQFVDVFGADVHVTDLVLHRRTRITGRAKHLGDHR